MNGTKDWKFYLKPLTQFDETILDREINDRSILDHLSLESRESLKDLMELDNNHHKVLQQFQSHTISSSKFAGDLDPVMVNMFATMAPILGNISTECKQQTRYWLKKLLTFKVGEPLWPLKCKKNWNLLTDN